MAITIQQKGLAGLYGKAATLAGRAQRSRELEQRAIRKQEQIASIQAQQESQQIQIEQQRSMRMLDAQLDLERYERAKRWEIDKMEISSRVDFEREEQSRKRKLDGIDSAIQQVDKEVMAGRITEQEATPIKQRLEISKSGVSVPISALAGDEGDRYGVRPYYLEPEFERDYPELAEAKKKEVISGQRRGTVPYYLDPEWLRANRDIAQQVLDSKGVVLGEDEIDALIGLPSEQPELQFMGYGKDRLATKSLDIGVRTEGEAERSIVEGTLDAATARQILTEAGGDKDRARQIARQRGYSF